MSYLSTVLEKLAKFFRGMLFWHTQYRRMAAARQTQSHQWELFHCYTVARTTPHPIFQDHSKVFHDQAIFHEFPGLYESYNTLSIWKISSRLHIFLAIFLTDGHTYYRPEALSPVRG